MPVNLFGILLAILNVNLIILIILVGVNSCRSTPSYSPVSSGSPIPTLYPTPPRSTSSGDEDLYY